MAHWLQPAFGDFVFDYDVDRIDALTSEREKEWARIGAATFLTDDEKREAVGYGKLGLAKKEDFAAVDVANADLGAGDAGGGGGAWQNQPRVPAGQPGGGEWTSGGGIGGSAGGADGGGESSGGDANTTIAEGGTTSIDQAAKMLGYDRKDFGTMIHALKKFNGLRGNDNIVIYPNGDVSFGGSILGSIHDFAR